MFQIETTWVIKKRGFKKTAHKEGGKKIFQENVGHHLASI